MFSTSLQDSPFGTFSFLFDKVPDKIGTTDSLIDGTITIDNPSLGIVDGIVSDRNGCSFSSMNSFVSTNDTVSDGFTS